MLLTSILLNIITLASLVICGDIKLMKAPELDESISINDDIFIIEFNEVNTISECELQQTKFKNMINSMDLKWIIRREFCTLFNGISFHAKQDIIYKMVELSMVKAIWPMISKRMPQYIHNQNQNNTTDYLENYSLTGVNMISGLNLDGSGIRIGIIDTGIDYLHPNLGGCFKEDSCKVKYGYDFVGDEYDGTNLPMPDEDPRDNCNGHGTHVAGIIGSKGQRFNGIAQNITLGAYKVFGCKNNARVESDIIIEAMEMAYKDSMNIINLSLGGGSSWPEYPDSKVADKLASLGVVVVAAAGNDGDKGLFEVSSPAIGNNVISVASFETLKYQSTSFIIDNLPLSKIDYSISSNSIPFNFTNIPIHLANDKDMLACDIKQLKQDKNIKDKILIVKRGACSFEIKTMNVQALGAIGIIIINNNPGTFTPLIKEEMQQHISIPIIGLTAINGNMLLNQFNTTNNKINISTPKYFINPLANKISTFSSWGPAPSLQIKPDLGAPGGLIYSTFPIELGMFATLSGTSMAAPFTSGIIALYLQYYKMNNIKFNLNKLYNKLYYNSQPKKTNSTGLAISVLHQGAGLINVNNLIRCQSYISPEKLILNNKENNNFTKIIQIQNNSENEVYSYEVEHMPAYTVSSYQNGNYLNPPINTNLISNIKFNQTQFILYPNESKQIHITIELPNQLNLKEINFLTGYIKVNHNQTDLNPYYIPYLINLDNYKQMPIFNVQEYPKIIINRNQKEYNNTNSNNTIKISFQNQDNLNIKLRIEHVTKLLLIKAVDTLGNEIGYIKGGINHFINKNDFKNNNLYYNFDFNGTILIPKKVENEKNGNKLEINSLYTDMIYNDGSNKEENNNLIDDKSIDYNENNNYNEYSDEGNILNSNRIFYTTNEEQYDSNYEIKNIVKGQIILKVMALKPNGNPNDKLDFQVWYSPVIEVDSNLNINEE